MSKQYPGGLITKTPVTPSGPYETSTASGIWTLDQQMAYTKQGIWPTAGRFPPDPQFNYVTMLLHGDGTNGAQNNTFLDSSTNNFTITRNGNTTQGSFSPYGSNWSNYFDGSGDYLSTPSSITLGSGDLTIEGWAYPTNTSGGVWYDFRGPDSGSAGNNPVIQWSTVTASKFTVRIDGTNAITSSSTFSTNNWHHVALVRSGTTVTLYVNGTSQGTYTTSTSFAQAYVRIGAYGGDGSVAFTGYASNLRAVIGTAIYTATFTPPTTPLTAVSGTALLTCQSNRFVDNSSNAYTITSTGNTSVQRFNPFGTSTAYSTSVIGGSGYFDGSGDTLTTSTSQIIPTGSFTVECWAYVTGTGNNQKFVAQGTSGSAGRFSLGIEGGNWWVQLGGDAIQTATPVRNQWNYVAVTYNGSTITLYVNGTSIGTVSSTANAQNTTLTIGQDWNSYITTGYISDVRISNTVRTISVPTAPYSSDGSTRLLLSMTNGAIFDNAMMNDLETVGNAQISTSVKKYGTGSMYFDGTGDALSAPSSTNFGFGSGNYTVELWVYGNFSGAYNTVFDNRISSAVGIAIYAGISSTLTVADNSAIIIAGGTISTNTWTHIAVVRNGTTVTAYINGTSVGSATDSRTYASSAAIFVGQNSSGSQSFTGYMDDFRITKGYARYTATFTPPTAAFSNTGPI